MTVLHTEWYRCAAGGALGNQDEGAAMAAPGQTDRAVRFDAIADHLGTADKIVQRMWNPTWAKEWLAWRDID